MCVTNPTHMDKKLEALPIYDQSLEDTELDVIEAVYKFHGCNQSKAALALKISRPTIIRKLKAIDARNAHRLVQAYTATG